MQYRRPKNLLRHHSSGSRLHDRVLQRCCAAAGRPQRRHQQPSRRKSFIELQQYSRVMAAEAQTSRILTAAAARSQMCVSSRQRVRAAAADLLHDAAAPNEGRQHA